MSGGSTKRATSIYMKILAVTIAASVILLTGCDRDKTPGETAGHVVYQVEKGAKKVAKEVGKEVKSFSHDAKEGFQDAKQKDIEKKKAREAEGK